MVVALFAGDAIAGEATVGKPALPADAADPAAGRLFTVEVHRGGPLRMVRGRARRHRRRHRRRRGVRIRRHRIDLPLFDDLDPHSRRPTSSCTSRSSARVRLVVPHDVIAFSFMLGCMTDSPVRRDLRRRRALDHVRHPRRHRVARQHPLLVPDALVRRVGRLFTRNTSATTCPWLVAHARLRGRVRGYRRVVVPPQGHPQLTSRQPISGSSWSAARLPA